MLYALIVHLYIELFLKGFFKKNTSRHQGFAA